MPTKREIARVLRRAAKMVDRGYELYGCDAIHTASPDEHTEDTALGVLWNNLNPMEKEGTYRGHVGLWPDDDPARVIGLLLAAEIVEQSE